MTLSEENLSSVSKCSTMSFFFMLINQMLFLSSSIVKRVGFIRFLERPTGTLDILPS